VLDFRRGFIGSTSCRKLDPRSISSFVLTSLIGCVIASLFLQANARKLIRAARRTSPALLVLAAAQSLGGAMVASDCALGYARRAQRFLRASSPVDPEIKPPIATARRIEGQIRGCRNGETTAIARTSSPKSPA